MKSTIKATNIIFSENYHLLQLLNTLNLSVRENKMDKQINLKVTANA